MADREDWQTGLCKLTQRACYMLDKSWRADVKFDVGPCKASRLISGHKLIMAMASPVFDAMFYGAMAEDVHLPIRIPDVDPDAFQVLLKYVYTDDITFENVDAALKLCYTAHKYMMRDLVRECIRFVSLNLTAENACNVYEFAKLLSVQFLEERCMEIFKYNTETVLRTDSFADSNLKTAFAVLSLDEMNVPSEEVVFYRTLAWGLQLCRRKGHEPTAENVRKELAECRVLFKTRYLAMTPAEFISISSKSKLFSDEEVLAILTNISVPGARAMPTSLSVTLEELCRQNRCRKKYFCRLIDESSDAKPNISNAVCSTEWSFHADKNFCLHGIVFDSSDNAADEEQVHIKVMEVRFYKLMVEYKLLVKTRWDRNVHLCFPSPLLVQGNTRYKLQITFHTSRAYYKFPILKNTQAEGVTFNLGYQNDVVAIHTVIFSHADVK